MYFMFIKCSYNLSKKRKEINFKTFFRENGKPFTLTSEDGQFFTPSFIEIELTYNAVYV